MSETKLFFSTDFSMDSVPCSIFCNSISYGYKEDTVKALNEI